MALGSPTKKEWPEAYQKAKELGFEFPQLPKRSIAAKVDNACEEAIELMDMMLSMNPLNRPDINNILQHPYFTNVQEEVVNPFTSPVGTPERVDSFSTHQFFSEPAFGCADAPSFGLSANDDSPSKKMDVCYSPVGHNELMGEGIGSHKKTKSLLNDGDGLPVGHRKFTYSHEKSPHYKKAKSTHEHELISDPKGENLGHLRNDDEITNTDTAIDIFADRVKKSTEEELPSFGSLVNEAAKAQSSTLTKSAKSTELGSFASSKSNNPFGQEAEYQQKYENDNTISGRYKEKGKFGNLQKEAPEFGAFNTANPFGGSSKPSDKPKKLSV